MSDDQLIALLNSFNRVAVCGYPRTGKTTISLLAVEQLPRTLVATDNYMGLPWSQASQTVAATVNNCQGPVIVEGMTVARALRKGMKVDAVVWLNTPMAVQTPGQQRMGAAALTVLREWAALHPGTPVHVINR